MAVIPVPRLAFAFANALLLTGSLFSPSAWAADWLAFRGSRGDGIARDVQPPIKWSSDENVLWRTPLMGPGNSSPVVVAGSVFLTAAREYGRQRLLQCFDLRSGEQRWERATSVDRVELTHISNPYCAATPVSDGESIIVWHGTGGLHCYSLDGELRWSTDFGEIRHLWGYGNSPVIFEDRVILHSGAGADHFVAAVRIADGETLWRVALPGGQSNETPDGELTGSWATPFVAGGPNGCQLVCAVPTGLAAFDPADGRDLWRCQGLASSRGKLVYASLLLARESIVAMAGYQGPMLSVRLGGLGDVSQTHRSWLAKGGNPQRIGSGVVVGDYIYIANADGGTIQCLEARTGNECYRQRVRGGPHWASTIFADGLLYATNQAGTTRVFRPNPDEFELVAENALHEQTHATPAFVGSCVYIRTFDNLYCIGKSVRFPAPAEGGS